MTRSWLRRCLWCASPGVAAFLVAAAVWLRVGAYPNIHDDFGNLLVADTLLHGRLSNPTPPSHELLQTFHVLVEPTYAAKFPIGPGALMALGQLIFGAWHTGMWMAAGLAAMAVTWMLMGAVSARWSWTFGMFVALHPVWQTGWSQEYTHGWLAVAAMALVLGGLIRMERSGIPAHWSHGVALALGLVLGMLSRPFEVAIVSSILCFLFGVRWIRRGWVAHAAFWTAWAPAAVILMIGFAVQGVVNASVTGSWLKLPYQLHEEQYGVAPVFVWQAPHEPALGHRFLEQSEFHRGWSMDAYSSAASWTGYWHLMGIRLWHLEQHWGWLLVAAPLGAMLVRRERWKCAEIGLAALATLCIINAIPWVSPNYIAPLIPAAVLLAAIGVRAGVHAYARSTNDDTRPFRQIRQSMGRVVMFGLLATQGIGLVASVRSMDPGPGERNPPWYMQRAQIQHALLAESGNHLVIVRYEPGHNIHHEWVFNGADPTSSRIVWARWDAPSTDRLVADYPGRNVWVLDVNRHEALVMQPYPKKDPSTFADGSKPVSIQP